MLNTAATAVLYLLESKGQEVTLEVMSGETYDASTGTYSGSSSTVTSLGYMADYNLSEIDGGSIVTGDRKLILPSTDISNNTLPVPAVGTKVTGVEKEVRVVAYRTIYEGTAKACYICQVRQ